MAALTLSGPAGFAGGSNQVSGPLVGYMDKNYVLRYSFSTPAGGHITSLTFASTFRHYNGGADPTYYIRVKVTESATSHIDASVGTSDYDATIALQGTANLSRSCTISGLWLKPSTTYYVFLFPGNEYFAKFCYDNSGNDLSSLSYDSFVATYTLSLSAGTGASASVKRTSSPSGSTGNLSNGSTIYAGDKLTVSFSASTGYSLSSASHSNGATITVSGNVSVSASAAVLSYTLSISAGTGTGISVSRTKSPLAGASSGGLSDGATIYYNDVLTISYSVSTGYNIATRTINGSIFSSGASHTVTAAVSVVTSATVISFKLSLSAGTGSTITVNRTSSPKQGAATGNLSNGATIYYSDVLKITTAANAGYEIKTLTVNGSGFTSGNSHTVTADVTIVTVTGLLGIVYIDTGSSVEKFLIYIDTGTQWQQFIPYIDNGSGWDVCH